VGKLALMPGDKVQLQEAPAVVTSSRSDDILAPLTDEDLTVQPKGLGDTGIFGLVGIGEVNPADKLHITSGTRAGIKLTKTGTLAGTVNFYNDGAFNINTPAAGFYVRSNNGNGDMHFYVRDFYFRDSGNNVFAKISNSSNLLALYDPVAPTDAKFRVEKDGDVRADGTVYAADFSTGSADVAERINTSEWVEAGNVVEIDPEHPGFFRKSTLPYSTKVAGIISTALMRRPTNGKTTVRFWLLQAGCRVRLQPRAARLPLAICWLLPLHLV
jgi:hypothetical protein